MLRIHLKQRLKHLKWEWGNHWSLVNFWNVGCWNDSITRNESWTPARSAMTESELLIRPKFLGRRYLSNATRLIRPHSFFCAVCCFKDHHNALHYSPTLKKACVRQVALDKGLQVVIYIYIYIYMDVYIYIYIYTHIIVYIYRERERDIYIYIYIYSFIYCPRVPQRERRPRARRAWY